MGKHRIHAVGARTAFAVDAALKSGSGSEYMSQPADAVRPEARPVLIAGDDHGRGEVAEGQHTLVGFLVDGQVDDVVGDAVLGERPLGGHALMTGGLGVHDDG